jgi:hypothetical protein
VQQKQAAQAAAQSRAADGAGTVPHNP